MHLRVLTTALLLTLVHAAESDGPQVLDPWIVVETRLPPDLAPVRASAVLPADAWSGRAIATLAEAFRQIPGATMQESFGGFEPPRLSIRGSGVQSAPSSRGLALLLDQLPIGLADGSFNSALLDPQVAGRIDVQRGPDGWRVAPATMGGALDFRTERTALSGVDLKLEAGSFGTRSAHASERFANDALTANAALSFSQQDGYREHSEQSRRTASASLGRKLGGDNRARFGLYHAHARYEVPGPLTLAAALGAPRNVSADVRRDLPQRESEFNRADAAFEHHTATRELEFRLSFARTADDFQQLQANGLNRSRSDDAGAHLTLAERFHLGEQAHQARFTATAARGWREWERLRNDAGRPGPRFGLDDLRPTTSVLQIEDTFAVTRRVAATVGIAQTSARRDITDRFAGSPPTRFSSDDVLPQAGLRWSVTRDTTVFGGVSSAAEAPTFDDLVVVTGTYPALRRKLQPLEAQHATTAEIGMRGRIAHLAWDAALYRATWRNEILRLADATGAARGAVNASPTIHDGIEAAARWLILDRNPRLSLAASAAWTRCRFESDSVFGQGRVAGVPPHIGNLELVADFPRGLFVAIGATWSAGTVFVDHAHRLSYGGHTLAQGRAGWRFEPYWTFFADVQNVFDHPNIASTAGILDLARNPAATAIFLPGAGRRLTFGVEWKR